MKNLYVCECCGQTFEDFDACYECENSHIKDFNEYELEPELIKRYQYKPGQKAPDKIIRASYDWQYDEEQEESKKVYKLWAYKLVGEVSATEQEKILKENAERKEEERIASEKYWAEREAKKKAEEEAKKAAEEAAQNEQTA